MFLKVESYIGGRSLAPVEGRYVDKFDPRTGEKLGEVANSGPQEVELAIQSAQDALPAWRDMRPSERGRILVELARIVRRSEDRLGKLESAETGKPGREMATLMDLTAQYFEFYAGLVNVMDGEVINQGPNYHVYTRHDPFGVIGAILPWNAPLHQAARAIAPALATGNTVVAKPSDHRALIAGDPVEQAHRTLQVQVTQGERFQAALRARVDDGEAVQAALTGQQLDLVVIGQWRVAGQHREHQFTGGDMAGAKQARGAIGPPEGWQRVHVDLLLFSAAQTALDRRYGRHRAQARQTI
ncbi:acyl-CoA reductase-like NAD-dependent aldehyde dehydrogenase [Metapseudomonas resinovorans]